MTRRTAIPAAVIVSSILVVTALHLATPLDAIVFHEIYQRLYYVPIISAALLFGLRGGLLAAVVVSLSYLPHIVLHWQHADFPYALNQYAELVLFFVVGALVGALGDRSRAARERAERTATELQRAYAELRNTFEQLVQADRLTSLGELAASVVHEIRNPLASIKGAVEIIEQEIPVTSPRREFALIARREIDRLNRLVDAFLRFARPPSPVVAPTDINLLIRSVTTLVERRADKNAVSIEFDPAGSLPQAMVDAEQITQVLVNLLINALDAMPHGGTIRVCTGVTADGMISIEVADEGTGIDPGLVARIFDPFFTTKDKGLGLGLSIAYRIAAQHSGSLTVRSMESGALFRLLLPSAAVTIERTDPAGGQG